MPYYTADLNADIRHYLDDQDRWLRSRPLCRECLNHIQEDTCYAIEDDLYCEACVDDARMYREGVCSSCGDAIDFDEGYEIGGRAYCETCMDAFRTSTDFYT